VTLVKNYDLKLEARGLAEMAGALANGHKEALGEDAQLVKLGKRKAAEDTSMEPKKNKEEVEPKKTEEVELLTAKEEVELKKTKEEEEPKKTKEEEHKEGDVWPTWDKAKALETEAWEDWDEAAASQSLDDLVAMYEEDSWGPWDEVEDKTKVKAEEKKDTKEETKVKAEEKETKKEVELATVIEEAKLVEQMMGSIVRQAVEGGGHLLQTWLNRKTCN